ncbi:hypothetical protein L5B97_05675 [Avibacterium sp. 20-15]|uniref:hypothetical protein n=1 Tax=unclassified Avibacterium TaxID=2685287 RepID=UPI0020260162|nr:MULTISPECIES: hypothetical protein [unclassified Avibacterium]MCW9732979.1 hypothetical protein [Avibacterium sp. 20-15]URL05110.1 hypothetical protein L4F93_04365 [Avibacterium sp. 20-132]
MTNPQSAIRNPQSAIRNPQSAIRNPQSAIRNPQSAIRNPQSAIRNKLIFSTLFASLFLTACNDPKEANKENFAKAIEEQLALQKSPAICISLPSGTYVSDQSPLHNAALILNTDVSDQRIQQSLAQADYFVKAGLLTSKADKLEKLDWGKKKILNVNVYEVTEQGKPFFSTGMFSRTKFCTGALKLDSVGTFTEPNERASGGKLSQVNYTVSYENVASWATNNDVEKLFGRLFDKAKNQQRTVLILTNEGWKSITVLNQANK